jgi:hypothetical protein
MLVNEVDHEAYDFLYRQEDLTLELEKSGVTLFRNEHPIARVYGVDNVVYIKNLEEYLDLSKSHDVMQHLYIMDNGAITNDSVEVEEIDYRMTSPVKYQIEETSHMYTIFTVPQNVDTEYWEYDGKRSLENLGFIPAFESSSDGGQIIYTRFYQVYVPSYVISVLTLAWVVWYYLYLRFRKPDSGQI